MKSETAGNGVEGGQPAKRHVHTSWLLWILPLAFLGSFFFYPLFRIFSLSFVRGQTGLLAPVIETLRSSQTLHVLGFTLGQALVSTLLTLLLGLPGAYLFARYDFRGKSTLRALSGIPFWEA